MKRATFLINLSSYLLYALTSGNSENKPRVWSSDSQLGELEPGRQAQAQKTGELTRHLASSLGAIQKSRNLNLFKFSTFSSAAPEKEKSKAMQTIEGKLMVAIKEHCQFFRIILKHSIYLGF